MPGITLSAYGRTIGLAGPEEVVQVALDLFPRTYRATEGSAERTWKAVVHSDHRVSILVDGTETGSFADAAEAIEPLVADIELWVAEHALGVVFVHAGCVVANGRAIVIPGYTWFGKTSLVTALVKAGAEYYSDEYAVIDDHGFAHPYPRSLRIRSRSGWISERVPVEALGGTAGTSRAPVGLVAVVRYDAQTEWAVAQIPRSQAAMQLLTHTVAAQSSPEAALRAIKQATAQSLTLEGVRGEADEAAEKLLRILDGL